MMQVQHLSLVRGAAGEIGYSKVKFWAADDCYPLVCSENISSRYIYHALLREQPRIKSQYERQAYHDFREIL